MLLGGGVEQLDAVGVPFEGHRWVVVGLDHHFVADTGVRAADDAMLKEDIIVDESIGV